MARNFIVPEGTHPSLGTRWPSQGPYGGYNAGSAPVQSRAIYKVYNYSDLVHYRSQYLEFGYVPQESPAAIIEHLTRWWGDLITLLAEEAGLTIKPGTLPKSVVQPQFAQARAGFADLMSHAATGNFAAVGKRSNLSHLATLLDWRVPYVLTGIILGEVGPTSFAGQAQGASIRYDGLMQGLAPIPPSMEELGQQIAARLSQTAHRLAEDLGITINDATLPSPIVEAQFTRARNKLPRVIDVVCRDNSVGIFSRYDQVDNAVACVDWRHLNMLLDSAAHAIDIKKPFGPLKSGEPSPKAGNLFGQTRIHRPLPVRQSADDRQRILDEMFGDDNTAVSSAG